MPGGLLAGVRARAIPAHARALGGGQQKRQIMHTHAHDACVRAPLAARRWNCILHRHGVGPVNDVRSVVCVCVYA